jgi:hypothetical protein
MANRWDRLAPLLGLAFVALLVVDITIGGSEPASGASAAKVVAWYTARGNSVRVSDYLMAVVLVVGFLFYGYLRDRLAEGSRGLAATAFGGAVLFAVSGAVSSGVQLALADTPGKLGLQTAHALNLLTNFTAAIAVSAGASALLIAGSIAILRGAQLPSWTGWLGLVLGVVALVPVANLGLIPAGVWTLVVSIVLFVRGSEVPVTGQPGGAQTVASGAR